MAEDAPTRFTIRPDDYHVPHAGTAGDGRLFFLTDELFSGDTGYVALFLWHADGTFDEARVGAVGGDRALPPGQAGSSDAGGVRTRLAELGSCTSEPIEVEPFVVEVDGTEFGWRVGRYDDGTWTITIVPGDFICYYAPWDGEEYDT